jgi:tRNA U34 5-methylaminomethyl-2-thiouridine-forming methyltransferase MnmC
LKANQIKYIEPKIIPTGDGSQTLWVEDLNETYHSTHGALQESLHVFIEMGLNHSVTKGKQNLRIFELGFGTGLNVFLTYIECAKDPNLKIELHSIEKYPVLPETALKMEYELLDSLAPWKDSFKEIIASSWNEKNELRENFLLKKISGDFFESELERNFYDLIFYDAFGARAQSEMWTEESFRICADIIKPGGALVTYASKGSARRALEKVGFEVEKLPGPPGKREMMRALYP